MINKMTLLQAFKAMICFLDVYYSKTLSDDLGSLLGDIQLFEDGSGTWDSAAWNDWVVALEKKESVTSIEGFKGVYNFLNAYYIRTSCSSSDIKALLDAMMFDEREELLCSPLWHTWIECVGKISNNN
ncbi:MAG TPA: hypothetical protein VJ201_05955 [Candidatus Babeliales bacterium]|nr:hypothetical protein [Candidatus Babeliales bacterium]HLC06815.1 hypothetical protein [Candidatus Babeliales bacterium]